MLWLFALGSFAGCGSVLGLRGWTWLFFREIWVLVLLAPDHARLLGYSKFTCLRLVKIRLEFAFSNWSTCFPDSLLFWWFLNLLYLFWIYFSFFNLIVAFGIFIFILVEERLHIELFSYESTTVNLPYHLIKVCLQNKSGLHAALY